MSQNHNMILNIKTACRTATDVLIPAGEQVMYIAHLPYGIIQVEWRGINHEISPEATSELSLN